MRGSFHSQKSNSPGVDLPPRSFAAVPRHLRPPPAVETAAEAAEETMTEEDFEVHLSLERSCQDGQASS